MTVVPSLSDGFWFDEAEADRAVSFVEEYCRHVKGPLAGHRLTLEPWQRDLVRELFGWRRPDGTRKHRFLWLEVPRKAGKTSLAAALGLYMLLVEPERGAEVVVAAGDADQAGICFSVARLMVEADKDLAAVCKLYRRSIVYKDSFLQVISARHETKHGANISTLILDEVHVQPSRDLHDTLITSMGARRQPLVIYITTAGYDRTSLCWELHDYAVKVRDGIVEDPSWLVRIFAAEPEDDWTDPAVWKKAHPGLGVSVSEDFLDQECRRAVETPGFVNSFRRLYLNVWTESSSRWLDMERWDRSGGTVDPEALRGRECRAGLDLSTTTDLTALVLTFRDDDGGFTALPFAFCPNETIRERSRKDRVDYQGWRDRGLLIATEGDVTDYDAVRTKLMELAEAYRIVELAFDRWNSSHLINDLVADGLACVPVGMGHATMNAPCRELERVVAAGLLRHGGHPVLRWCAANTVVEMTAAGDIKPTKAKSTERIDLVVALLMGMSRWIANPGKGPSVYAERGLVAFDLS